MSRWGAPDPTAFGFDFLSTAKVTTVRGDAADEALISGICKRALQEEGHLDVFFANAGIVGPHRAFSDFTKEEFLKVLDVNVTR